jgi:hypothetical protein
MNRQTIITAALSICIMFLNGTQAKSDNKAGAPTITTIKLNIIDESFELRYEIRNRSDKDIWICKEVDIDNSRQFESYLAEDRQTLVIRRRLDVPIVGIFRDQPRGRYMRLRAGQIQTESLLLSLPVRRITVFNSRGHTNYTVYVKRLILEIGYYCGDLPAMVLHLLEGEEEAIREGRNNNLDSLRKYLGSVSYFNAANEDLNFESRDEQVIIPWSNQTLNGERLLQLELNGLHLPYSSGVQRFTIPELDLCTKLEIQYQPSTLGYFFPYVSQMNLLSPTENRKLTSVKSVVVDDTKSIGAFVQDVSKATLNGGIIHWKSAAHVVCYHDKDRLTSFTIYDNAVIATNETQRFFLCADEFPSLIVCTPQIHPFDLRVQCASNMKNLWYRLQLYQQVRETQLKGPTKTDAKIYPPPAEWCADMVRAYDSAGMSNEALMRPHICPSAGLGENHYAMNPNCKPDSPPDVVLLFETKAGWNQHGGPELFTFDNHDPKGGCVLLNDGTVKFIRTPEELRQLRWK